MRSFEEEKNSHSQREYESNKSRIEAAILKIFENSEDRIIRKGLILSTITQFDSGAVMLALDSLVKEGRLSEIKSARRQGEVSYKKND